MITPAKIIRALRRDDAANYIQYRMVSAICSVLDPSCAVKRMEFDWMLDKGFAEALSKFGEGASFNKERRVMIVQLMRLTDAIPGDTAECGVFIGMGSYLICAANSVKDRHHHIFDSFEGLSQPGEKDGHIWQKGDMSRSEEVVRLNLAQFQKGFSTYKGWIPDRFHEVADLRFSFVHIDVDLYQPTLDSISFFYDRMNPGGVILCDDYGHLSCPGVSDAVNEFLSDKREKMISLSAGGGFMIKGVACD
jgi:O-methyltransferase